MRHRAVCACTVHVDGRPVRSCVLSVGNLQSRAITTIEGVGATPVGARVQKAWLDLEVWSANPTNMNPVPKIQEANAERTTAGTNPPTRPATAIPKTLGRCSASLARVDQGENAL
jgi:hypothetical protein